MSRETLKVIGAKAKEAAGLLKLIQPLCDPKRVQGLSPHEADALENTVRNAYYVLSDAIQAIGKEYNRKHEERKARENAVAREGNGHG